MKSPFPGVRASIIFDSENQTSINHLSWSSWTATGATGYGIVYDAECVPNCVTPIQANIMLSQPANGEFTLMTETAGGVPR